MDAPKRANRLKEQLRLSGGPPGLAGEFFINEGETPWWEICGRAERGNAYRRQWQRVRYKGGRKKHPEAARIEAVASRWRRLASQVEKARMNKQLIRFVGISIEQKQKFVVFEGETPWWEIASRIERVNASHRQRARMLRRLCRESHEAIGIRFARVKATFRQPKQETQLSFSVSSAFMFDLVPQTLAPSLPSLQKKAPEKGIQMPLNFPSEFMPLSILQISDLGLSVGAYSRLYKYGCRSVLDLALLNMTSFASIKGVGKVIRAEVYAKQQKLLGGFLKGSESSFTASGL